MASAASIEIRQVSKIFPGRGNKAGWKALDNANFTVHPGEFVCILGPSGCGKSTLLNILSGLDGQYEGVASIHGRSAAERSYGRARVAYVFQEPRLMPWRTVRGNIEFALRAAGFAASEWKGRIARCLELVGLADFGEFYPLQLSGGMQQRASIARAFAIDPEVLLMDEPFSALDELTARRLRQELLTIWDTFRSTVLFVTHNAFEATFLSDRILMMTKGPGARFCDEIDLGGLVRPRSYEDVRVFETSRAVVERLIGHIGSLDDA
ncbi:MAG TPA: ABC transporter ATP-binding protein [Stellaceae bacterium]|nr:ABC transporter ATP-binding protein [Stellaceae bacterium]